jgi:hypothetical protein
MEYTIHFRKGQNGRKQIREGKAPDPEPLPVGNIPRISKLMALAIKMDGMIRDGIVKDYTELATLGRVTCARITQIMNLLYLAPDIQEEILFLDRVTQGKDPITEKRVGKLAMVCNWSKQRRQWIILKQRS